MLSLTKWRLLIALCGGILAAPGLFAQTGVRINEVLASNESYISNGETTDWVELYNPTGAAITLSGRSLSDDFNAQQKWVFPNPTVIQPNTYLVIAFDPERAASTEAGPNLNTGFGLTADGTTLYIFGLNFDEVIDSVAFGHQVTDYSIGRVGAEWKLCKPTPGVANIEHTQFGSVLDLRINEWLANPTDAFDDDFIEIFNKSAQIVNMSGLFLTDTPATTTDDFQIAPLSFIGSGLNAFAVFLADGNTENGPDHLSFGLGRNGDRILLLTSAGATIDSVEFGAQGPDESGGLLPDGSTVKSTFPTTASPGRSNYKTIPTLWISEVLTHTDPPQEDAVEIYNDGALPANISGWYLSNRETDLKRYKIPPNTIIPSKQYKVFYENAFGFTINSAHGDQIYLAEADANGNLTGFRIGEDIDAAENGVSFGRVQTSVDYKFVALSSITFGNDGADTLEEFRLGPGAPNSGPKIGPIVINEVNYHPFDLEADNTDDEFIELHNVTSEPVNLYHPTFPQNRWRLQNGVSFVFPANVSIPAQGYALVVSFDPIFEAAKASSFRTRNGVPTAVKLYGPFLGDLSNSDDSLELYRADTPQGPEHPDFGFVPYLRVDKVNYTDSAPWPGNADNTGNSIQKRNPRSFGNDPVNWAGAAPTPGRANSPELMDSDGDGMPDTWEQANGFNKDVASDGPQDFDNDGFTNLQEFLAGTNPKNAASRLEIKRVVAAASETAPLTITFVAAANVAYKVQYRNSLAVSGEWDKIADVPAQTNEREVTVEDINAWGRTDRYYRVVVE